MICSSSELRTNSADVYNKVQEGEVAIIDHRSRPNMVLIRQDTLERVLKSNPTEDAAVILADLTF